MSAPRYRTLNGVELELPVHVGGFVVVPRTLADSEPDLIWAFEYDDVEPLTPQVRDELGGDPDLDLSAGALLVPIERWAARAATEPALVASCSSEVHGLSDPGVDLPLPVFRPAPRSRRVGVAAAGRRAGRAVTGTANVLVIAIERTISAAALILALSFAAAVGQWLLVLRDGMSGSELGTGATLLLAGMLLSGLTRRTCHACAVGRLARALFAAGAMLVAAACAAFALGLVSP